MAFMDRSSQKQVRILPDAMPTLCQLSVLTPASQAGERRSPRMAATSAETGLGLEVGPARDTERSAVSRRDCSAGEPRSHPFGRTAACFSANPRERNLNAHHHTPPTGTH